MKDNITPQDNLKVVEEVARKNFYRKMTTVILILGGASWLLGYYIAMTYFAIVFFYYLVRWGILAARHGDFNTL